MRVLFVTWDGAGNTLPTLALISALTTRGHEVFVLGHDSQEDEITKTGAHFRRYATAPQFDQGRAQAAFDFQSWFRDFNEVASRDFFNEFMQLSPNVIVVDCMMSPSLEMGWSTGKKLVALVHGAYSAMAPWTDNLNDADLILSCSYEAFDKDTRVPRKTTFVGPLRPISTGTSWKQNFPERPLVVASLSTGIQGPFQLGMLQRICDALSTLPVEGLVTTGRGIAPEELSAASNVSIVRSIDHAVTLPHAALFITHCGHGSIMASLRAGVPMLCLPPVADQPLNAELVRRLELGEVLDVTAPVTVIVEAVTRLINDAKIQKAAKKFARKNTYEPKLDKAAKLVEKLAR